MNWFKRRQEPQDFSDAGLSLFSERQEVQDLDNAGLSLFNNRRGLANAGNNLFKKRRASSNSRLYLRKRQEDPLISWFRERRQDPLIQWFNEKREDTRIPINWFSIRQDPTASALKEEDVNKVLDNLSLFRRENHANANSKLSKGNNHPQLKLKASIFKGILSSKRNGELNSAIFKKGSGFSGKFRSRKSHDSSKILKLKA